MWPELYVLDVDANEWSLATSAQHRAIVEETASRGRTEELANAIVRLLDGHEHMSLCGCYVFSLRPPIGVYRGSD